MTQRRRMSRAQVERDPTREVRPGISARTWRGDPPAQTAAPVLSVEALREMQRVLTERSAAMPRAMVAPPWLAREAERFAADPYYPDAMVTLPSRQTMQVMRERADAERRAVERTGRILAAWLIGRWRR